MSTKHIVQNSEKDMVIYTSHTLRDIRDLINKSEPKDGDVVDHYTPIDRVTIYAKYDDETISVSLSQSDLHKLIRLAQTIEKPFKQAYQGENF